MKPFLLATLLLAAATQSSLPHSAPTATTLPQSDTLTALVAPYPGPGAPVVKGSTHDLLMLDIRTLNVKSAIMITGKPDSADELLIVKEGSLTLKSLDSMTGLGPGSVALIPAGIAYSLEANNCTLYRFRFQSRRPAGTSPPRVSGSYPFIMTWPNMPVQHTAKGETRQILSKSTPWLSKIDLHATTLNPGEESHPPHTHRAEEIILMRTGHVQEYINGNHYPAADGDLIFLPSGNPHALENHSTQRAEYFALQWLP